MTNRQKTMGTLWNGNIMAYQAGSYFPKDGYSATQTELKVLWTNIRWNITETLAPKQATENHITTPALEQSVMNYWGL